MSKPLTGTLVRPRPVDPTKSEIENVLELTPLTDIGPDIFTNTRPLWHPPSARGIYGGAAIAQCLAAAQATIPPPSAANSHAHFFVHSMHCYFVLAGDSTIPVLYHVERVREGKSFMTRTVQARQRGRCIFTTTLSFVREGSAGEETVGHEWALPAGAAEQLAACEAEAEGRVDGLGDGGGSGGGPFESRRMEVGSEGSGPQTRRTRQWVRARGRISPEAGPQAHLSALAYMSDSYFIGTVARVHNLWRFGRPSKSPSTTVAAAASSSAVVAPTPESPNKTLPPAPAASPASSPAAAKPSSDIASLEARENSGANPSDKTIGMMVSLDHTIFFHKPRAIRADEWLFAEMESPWAGDGRGLVLQKIWNRGGELVATCVQEGVVRLVQGREKVKL